MWYFWWMDPDDYAKGVIIGIIGIMFFIGYGIWKSDESQCKDKKTIYDTVQNDSVIILKMKGHWVYDTVGKTDSTIVLKKRMVYD